jgi:hypothetical protein
MTDLMAVTEAAPDFVEGHLSLGTFWIQRRAQPALAERGRGGALGAFEQALKLAPTSLLARNGRACALYAHGKWEEASAEFHKAANDGTLAMLPFVLRNLREVAVTQEAVRKESEGSPKFWRSDFLDWAALREASLRDGDLLRDVLGGRALPAILDEATLDRLNAVLDDPAFYEQYKDRFDLTQARAELLELLEKTSSARKKRASDLTEAEKDQIRRLNRMLIELAYVYLIERYDRRHPGTTLAQSAYLRPNAPLNIAMSMGPNQPGQGNDARVLNPWLSTARAVSAASLGPVTVVATPVVATWNSLNTHQQLTVLKVTGVAITTIAVPAAQLLPIPPPARVAIGGVVAIYGATISAQADMGLRSLEPKSGGAMADVLRRPYIDKGNWNLEAPFGLAYYEREGK